MKYIVMFSVFASLLFPISRVHAVKQPRRISRDVAVQIIHLDYSCFRTESGAKKPVFIEKRKPVIDILKKIDRCFVGVAGYPDPVFTATYTKMDGVSTHEFTQELSKETWVQLSPGCYSAHITGNPKNPENISNLHEISCRMPL